MKLRAERFGAWVRPNDHTLIAVDRHLASALGVADNPLWHDALYSAEPAPLEAHVAVTSRCPVGCNGCYQSATRDGDDVSLDELTHTLDALAREGVFTVAFGGGEPCLRSDLGALATLARARGLVPVVTTSGLGLTPAFAATLCDFAQVNVSHDGVAGGYAAVRGFEGEAIADRAVRTLVAAGIAVGVNHVLTRQNIEHLGATVRHVRALGAREIQLLRYKPAGRAASPEYLARRLSPEQVRGLGAAVRALAEEHSGALSLRIDCALVPLLSEVFDDAAALERFGVFGCEAGRYLTAVRRNGARAGCSFMRDDDLARLRTYASDPPEPCRSCTLRSVCRGGCRVVSEHLSGNFVPDPECPRVRHMR